MSTVEFQLDHQGIAAYLRSPEVRELVVAAAERGAEFARRIAPHETGEYAEGIHAGDGGLGGRRHDRHVGLIVATAPHSAAVEFGNAHVPAQHVLGRTLAMIEAG